MNNANERVEAGVAGASAKVRVVGHGSFRAGPALRQFGLQAVERGCREVVCDLADCQGMDSTFTGVLAQIGLDLKRQEGGALIMRGMNAKVEKNLRTLGLDRIAVFRPAEAPPAEPSDMTLRPLEVAATPDKTILDAHQTLSGVSEENRLRFRNVIEYLKAES
jgi:anti-anti-sigma regulatory factor